MMPRPGATIDLTVILDDSHPHDCADMKKRRAMTSPARSSCTSGTPIYRARSMRRCRAWK
jgi:hypothetical protein